MSVRADKALFRYLDSDGDGGGTKDMATAADDYFIQPPSGSQYHLERLLIQIQDNANMNAGSYGAAAALATGVSVLVRDGAGVTIVDLTDGVTIKTNEDWARQCFDTSFEQYSGGGSNKVLNIRWTLSRGLTAPLLLTNRQQFVVSIPDDLSSLVSHYIMVQGFIS